jgi:hypothetical protein
LLAELKALLHDYNVRGLECAESQTYIKTDTGPTNVGGIEGVAHAGHGVGWELFGQEGMLLSEVLMVIAA